MVYEALNGTQQLVHSTSNDTNRINAQTIYMQKQTHHGTSYPPFSPLPVALRLVPAVAMVNADDVPLVGR